eukprot:SAG22_NODE_2645_length_2339_cov_7.678125_2_plen_81_part_00
MVGQRADRPGPTQLGPPAPAGVIDVRAHLHARLQRDKAEVAALQAQLDAERARGRWLLGALASLGGLAAILAAFARLYPQ